MSEEKSVPRDVDVPTSGSSPKHSKRLYVIFLILAMYFYALGIDVFTGTEYTQHAMKELYFPHKTTNESFNTCSVNTSNANYKLHQKVQQNSAEWTIYYDLALSLPASLTSLILGPLTDRFGRKFLLAIALFGFSVKLATWTLVSAFSLSLYYVVAADVVCGACGGFYATLIVVFSMVSDVTANGNGRTVLLVATELFIGAIVSAAAVVTGYFLESHGFFPSMLLATCLSCSSLVLTIFVLPETLQLRDTSQTVSIISSAKRCAQFYTTAKERVVRHKYICLILGFIFYSIAMLNKLQIDTLYALGSPFCWSPSSIGWLGTARIGASTLGSFIILLPLRRCFADDTIAMLAEFTVLGSLIVEAFASSDLALYASTFLGIPGSIPIPVIRSLMSQLTPAEQQGALFASIGFVQVLSTLLGALTMNAVYSASMSIMNGLVFLILAAIVVVGIGFIGAEIYIRRRSKGHKGQTQMTSDSNYNSSEHMESNYI